MASSPTSKQKATKALLSDRLQKCWSNDIDWELYPEKLKLVLFAIDKLLLIIVHMYYKLYYVHDGKLQSMASCLVELITI